MKIDNNLKNIFDSLYDGILIIDKNGIVVYTNPSYSRITKINKEDIVNKRLLDVRKDSHLTKVMKTGIKEIGQYRTINNIKYIVNMVPIIEKGEIVGGISVLNDMQDIQKNLDKTLAILDNLKEKVKILNKSKYSFDSIIAVDKSSVELKNYSKKISLNDSNILITGESGTGKKIYAHAIHNGSNRASFPFIAINCTTYSKENLEKELFGLEQDAFYDEKKRKIGLLQLVDGGTLFLDEISELDYSLQTKLLHVLQEKTFTKMESLKEIPVDFRLISTTNKNLLELVNQGKFRKDLYYRISVIPLNLLPLKNRKGDILALANKFLKDLSIKYRREVSFSEDVIKILLSYDWSGNIRELRNIVEFLFNISDSSVITIEDLPDYLYLNKKNESYKNLNDYLKECEKKYIKKILSNFENNLEGKKKTAKLLGISLATLYNKLS
ncbi:MULTISPECIES: sigma 54-interacting transcriptional regulator [Fusobacterium]|jgi:nitrogen regulation protein|uniref:PAS domain-containing protein n=2 Tax=Fusobacterium TaxID=848 RepID=A0A323TXX1_FUSNU|nr:MULTISPECIES: sigma 54-interacting transcriptional regulator [Fusobacterium]MBW9310425.1 PAS domain-containing protein [Fusobacterium nucleatum]PCR84062.1 Fis family transcriptional regulator [Fusobacterium nucleatum]PHI17299.1 Fis family transcriptional regulator [Fusobacterium polymorphum]PZA04649.1 PAS domain-containing protein [Fusobacterium nucleatum]QJX50867.1 sigma 54-interacting transcriptional regulator [Fusobacterium nucleatum]